MQAVREGVQGRVPAEAAPDDAHKPQEVQVFGVQPNIHYQQEQGEAREDPRRSPE